LRDECARRRVTSRREAPPRRTASRGFYRMGAAESRHELVPALLRCCRSGTALGARWGGWSWRGEGGRVVRRSNALSASEIGFFAVTRDEAAGASPGDRAPRTPSRCPPAHRERHSTSPPKPFTLNPESPFTLRRIRCSRCPGNPDHHQPEYAPIDRPRSTSCQ
jgi:hypothetical protein